MAILLSAVPSLLAQTEEPDINAFVFADEEPKPLNLGDVRQQIGYPEQAIEQNIQGNVVVRLLVDEEGQYIRHKIITSANPILRGAVEDHVAELQFSPARVDGKAIKFWINIPFSFKLLDERTEDLKAAIDSLTQLIVSEPDNYTYYHQRGVNQSQLGKNPEAIADLDKSLLLNPRKNKKKAAKNTYNYLVYTHYSRAAVRVGMELYDSALVDYEKALRYLTEMKVQDSAVSAMLPLIRLERGYTYMLKEDFEKARIDYRWVLKNDTSQRCTVYPLLADIGITEKNNEELTWVYTGLMECEPENGLLWYSRGYYRLESGDFTGAIEDFAEVQERNENRMIRIAAHNQSAQAYLKLGQVESAEAAIDAAIGINALNPQSYFFRGNIEEGKGNMEAACKDWVWAMEFGLGGSDQEKCQLKLDEHCGGWQE